MPRKVNRRSSLSKRSLNRNQKRLRLSAKSKKPRTKPRTKPRSKPRFHKLKKSFCSRKRSQKKANHNLAKYVKEVNGKDKTCQIMTPHGNVIDLPSEYPGDDFVFSELYTNPADKYHAEMVDSSILRETYNTYHKMCF